MVLQQTLDFSTDQFSLKPLLSGNLIITPNVVRRPEYVESLAAIISSHNTRVYIDHFFNRFIRLIAQTGERGEEDKDGIVDAFSRWLFRRSYLSLGPKQLHWLHASCTKLLKLIENLCTNQQAKFNVVHTVTRYLRKGLVTARTITESLLDLIRTSRSAFGSNFRVIDYGCKVKAVLEKHIVLIDISKVCNHKLIAWIRQQVPQLPTREQSQRRLAVLLPISINEVVRVSIVALSPILGDDIGNLLDKTVDVLMQIDP